MTQQKKWIWPAASLAVAAAVAGYMIRARDGAIESEREASAQQISNYEQKVKKADQELRGLEAQIIALNDLAEIEKLQTKALNSAKLLISLAPLINHPNKVDRTSQASVNAFNNGLKTYDNNITVYQSQMSDLNSIVNRANKQYVIKAVQPSFLDRSTLSSRRKFAEIIGLAQTPVLAPSTQIEGINNGIAERSKKQEAIRNAWNNQAPQIN
ncbi:MAG: hypothetical protein ACKOZW_03750, partial [Cyanobium sp.]